MGDMNKAIKNLRDAVITLKGQETQAPKSKLQDGGGRSGFESWMEDVEEAVDQFIGMPVEVLPKVPWKKWFESGVSPLKAAKNAVQMQEDLEEDESPDEEDSDTISVTESYVSKLSKRASSDVKKLSAMMQDLGMMESKSKGIDKKPSKGLRRKAAKEDARVEEENEIMLRGHIPYHKWYSKISKALETEGISLYELKSELGFEMRDLHNLYGEGYGAYQVVDALLGVTEDEEILESILDKNKKYIFEVAQTAQRRTAQSIMERRGIAGAVSRGVAANAFRNIPNREEDVVVTKDMVESVFASCAGLIKPEPPAVFVPTLPVSESVNMSKSDSHSETVYDDTDEDEDIEEEDN